MGDKRKGREQLTDETRGREHAQVYEKPWGSKKRGADHAHHRAHRGGPDQQHLTESEPRNGNGDGFYVGRNGRGGNGLPPRSGDGFHLVPPPADISDIHPNTLDREPWEPKPSAFPPLSSLGQSGPYTPPITETPPIAATDPLPSESSSTTTDRVLEEENSRSKWRWRAPWLLPLILGAVCPSLSRKCDDTSDFVPTPANTPVPTCDTLREHDFSQLPKNEAKLRTNLLTLVEKDIGQREQGGDNRGAFVREVMHGVEGKSWCTGWLTDRLNKVAPGLVPYTWSTHNLVEAAEKQHAVKSFDSYTPHPGDVFFVLGGPDTKKPSHSAVVKCVMPGGVIEIVSGNKKDDMGLRQGAPGSDGVFQTLLTPQDLQIIAGSSHRSGFISVGGLLQNRNIPVPSATGASLQR